VGALLCGTLYDLRLESQYVHRNAPVHSCLAVGRSRLDSFLRLAETNLASSGIAMSERIDILEKQERGEGQLPR
jgi:hypothetical protein